MRLVPDPVMSIGAVTTFRAIALSRGNLNLCVVAKFGFILQAGQ
jgi:hypothetical protein